MGVEENGTSPCGAYRRAAPLPRPTQRPPAWSGHAFRGSLSVSFHAGGAKPSATVERLEALSPDSLLPLPVEDNRTSVFSTFLSCKTGHRPLQWGCQEDSTRCCTKNESTNILSAFHGPICLLAPLNPATKAWQLDPGCGPHFRGEEIEMLSCSLGQVVVPSSEARFLAFTAAGQHLGLQRESAPTVSSRTGLSSPPLPGTPATETHGDMATPCCPSAQGLEFRSPLNFNGKNIISLGVLLSNGNLAFRQQTATV